VNQGQKEPKMAERARKRGPGFFNMNKQKRNGGPPKEKEKEKKEHGVTRWPIGLRRETGSSASSKQTKAHTNTSRSACLIMLAVT
jgi:hypothetical protein